MARGANSTSTSATLAHNTSPPAERSTYGTVTAVTTDDNPSSVDSPQFAHARELVRAQLFDLTEAQVSVGRFILGEKLGAGGMGIVFAAHDPELDRSVAIKMLHSTNKQHKARLLREAKAMARLTHPNVVAVYEAGIEARQVYLVMERVTGKDLRSWLKAQPRAWRQVLELLVDAATGLEAAHRAGLVHRDFKPENVLVTAAGRAKVADFGLARMTSSEATLEDSGDDSPARTPMSLTQTGTVVGTPAYLPPEVAAGKAAQAHSDQFSFCVTAYEALYGERPFAGDDLETVLDNVREGQLRPAPAGRKVPAGLRRVLLRGLAADPAARHGSMEKLRIALHAQGRRVRGRALVAAGVGIVGLAAVGLAWPKQPAVCTGAAAALAPSWSEARKDALLQAMRATEQPEADATAQRTATRLDRYAERWTQAHRQACLATQQGAQSDTVLDQRMRCLDTRRMALTTLADTLSNSTTTRVTTALAGVARLPAVDDCANIDQLTRVEPLPEDPRLRRAIVQLRQDIARTRTLRGLGLEPDHGHSIAELQRRADALGNRSVMARVRLEGAVGRGPTAQVRDELYEALVHAEAAGDDRQRLEAWSALAETHGYLKEHDQGLRAGANAQAILDRTGNNPAAQAALFKALGYLNIEKADLPQAVEFFRQAVEIEQQRESTQLSSYLGGLGTAYTLMDAKAKAYPIYERAYEESLKSFGRVHPNTAHAMMNLGRVAAQLDRLEQSNAWYIRSLEVSVALDDEGSLAPIMALSNLGQNYGDQGHYTEAIATVQRALAKLVRLVGPEHRYLVRMRRGLAEIYLDAGDMTLAVAEGEHALAISVATFGEGHPETSSTRRRLGQIHLLAGSPQQARPLLESALADHQVKHTSAMQVAISQYWLYRALATDNADVAQARELAQAAIAVLAEGSARQRTRALELTRWVVEHQTL